MFRILARWPCQLHFVLAVCYLTILLFYSSWSHRSPPSMSRLQLRGALSPFTAILDGLLCITCYCASTSRTSTSLASSTAAFTAHWHLQTALRHDILFCLWHPYLGLASIKGVKTSVLSMHQFGWLFFVQRIVPSDLALTHIKVFQFFYSVLLTMRFSVKLLNDGASTSVNH